MDNESKTYYGQVYSWNSQTGQGGVTEVVVEQKHCDVWYPLVQGDFKTPNNFGFRIWRGRGSPALLENKYTSQGRVHTQVISSDSYSGSGYGYAPYGALDWPLADDQALGSLLDQLKAGNNVAVDMAEGGQTIKMIRNMMNVRKMMKEVVTQVVKGKKFRSRSRGQNRLDYVTSKWLEYRYGWLPFVNSTYEILKTLSKKVDGGLFVARGRSVHSDLATTSTGSGSYYDPKQTRTHNLRFRTEIVAQFRLPETRQIYDWTTLNPATIAWELTPLSFVADWFVNVGETLSLWENQLIFANKFVRGYKTRSYKEEMYFSSAGHTVNPVPYWPGTTTIYDGVTFERHNTYGYLEERLYKDRAVLDSLPTPAAGLRVKVKMNAQRSLDAAALIHTLTKSMGKKHGF